MPVMCFPGAVKGGTNCPGGYQGNLQPYVSQSKTWGPVSSTPASDSLSITGTNVATMTIDVIRAHVDCNVHLAVTSDGPLTVTLAGCPSSTTAFF
jgi:hypothetical protein